MADVAILHHQQPPDLGPTSNGMDYYKESSSSSSLPANDLHDPSNRPTQPNVPPKKAWTAKTTSDKQTKPSPLETANVTNHSNDTDQYSSNDKGGPMFIPSSIDNAHQVNICYMFTTPTIVHCSFYLIIIFTVIMVCYM